MFHSDLTVATKYFFSALSDETRLRILSLLRERGGMCVNDISAAIGRDQSLVSHHVRCLRNCGFLTMEKSGKFSIYAVRTERIPEILDLADQHVRGMSESILHCDVVADRPGCARGPAKPGQRLRLMDRIGSSVRDRCRDAALTRFEDDVRICILREFARRGRPPTVAEIAEHVNGASEKTVQEAIARLEAADLLTTSDGAIAAAYPFSADPTRHTVVFADGRAVHALCATDAMGIHFMLGVEITVQSHCPECEREVVLHLRDGAIAERAPDDAVEFAAVSELSGCTAGTCCPTINLFCGRDHADRWAERHPEVAGGEVYTLEDALDDGKLIFGELLARTAVASWGTE
jgi:DNA-binding transcriptional ArsR family regulator